LLFIISINDLIDVCQNSTLFLYADDAKIYRLVTENNDGLELQNDLNNFNTWSTNWQLTLYRTVMPIGTPFFKAKNNSESMIKIPNMYIFRKLRI